jgi:hypothetical protein
MDFWIIYCITIVFILVLYLTRFIKPWHKKGGIDAKTFENMTLVIPIAKTVYKVVGHYSKTSKTTAKDKLSRVIKKDTKKFIEK